MLDLRHDERVEVRFYEEAEDERVPAISGKDEHTNSIEYALLIDSPSRICSSGTN
jgi:hypothetical protein